MKFEYTVKYNGRRYLPGEDVPMDEPKAEISEPVIEEVEVKEVEAEVVTEEKPKTKAKGKKKSS